MLLFLSGDWLLIKLYIAWKKSIWINIYTKHKHKLSRTWTNQVIETSYNAFDNKQVLWWHLQKGEFADLTSRGRIFYNPESACSDDLKLTGGAKLCYALKVIKIISDSILNLTGSLCNDPVLQ